MLLLAILLAGVQTFAGSKAEKYRQLSEEARSAAEERDASFREAEAKARQEIKEREMKILYLRYDDAEVPGTSLDLDLDSDSDFLTLELLPNSTDSDDFEQNSTEPSSVAHAPDEDGARTEAVQSKNSASNKNITLEASEFDPKLIFNGVELTSLENEINASESGSSPTEDKDQAKTQTVASPRKSLKSRGPASLPSN